MYNQHRPIQLERARPLPMQDSIASLIPERSSLSSERRQRVCRISEVTRTWIRHFQAPNQESLSSSFVALTVSIIQFSQLVYPNLAFVESLEAPTTYKVLDRNAQFYHYLYPGKHRSRLHLSCMDCQESKVYALELWIINLSLPGLRQFFCLHNPPQQLSYADADEQKRRSIDCWHTLIHQFVLDWRKNRSDSLGSTEKLFSSNLLYCTDWDLLNVHKAWVL